jgi:hypothetical protein
MKLSKKTHLFAIIAFLLVVFFFGCSSKNYPQQSTIEKIVTIEKTVYKDTTITRTIPGDTVIVEKVLSIPVPNLEPIKAENQYAMAQAWVFNGKQHLHLLTKPKAFNFDLKNKAETIYITKDKIVESVVNVRFIPKMYKASFYIIVSQIILGIAVLIHAIMKFKGKVLGGLF